LGKLVNISGRKAIKAFHKIGYILSRREGSHMILYNPKPGYPILSIPDHKELAPYLLKREIQRSHLTVEQFLKLLK